MSWSGSYRGPAKDIEISVPYALDGRQKEHKAAAEDAAKALAEKLGGCHVSVSASGHANPEPSVGDTISVSVGAIAAEPEAEAPKVDPTKTGWGRNS
jgi:hypothetical protein